MLYLLIYHNNYHLHHQNWGNRNFCKKRSALTFFIHHSLLAKKKKKIEKHNELFFLVKVLRK